MIYACERSNFYGSYKEVSPLNMQEGYLLSKYSRTYIPLWPPKSIHIKPILDIIQVL